MTDHTYVCGTNQLASGSSSTKYRYGAAWGYITDPSGMLQLGARFYWPEVGRFVQRDPAKDGMNWYIYAGSNPVAEVDPSGYGIIACIRCCWCTGKILKARHQCVKDHPDWCETWETDDQMGDRVTRMSKCIEQYTRPGYIAYCAEVCLKCWGTRLPKRPR